MPVLTFLIAGLPYFISYASRASISLEAYRIPSEIGVSHLHLLSQLLPSSPSLAEWGITSPGK
jgi:hypothetical protein